MIQIDYIHNLWTNNLKKIHHNNIIEVTNNVGLLYRLTRLSVYILLLKHFRVTNKDNKRITKDNRLKNII